MQRNPTSDFSSTGNRLDAASRLATSIAFALSLFAATVSVSGAESSLNASGNRASSNPLPSIDHSTWSRPVVDDDGHPMPSSDAAIPLDSLSRTEFGHYLTAREAYALKQWLGKDVLFVDIRNLSSGEWGLLPEGADFNLPLIKSIAQGKPEFVHGFVGGIKRALATRGLHHESIVVLICIDGRSAAIGADLLAQAGVSNAFVVRGGMDGEVGSADHAGWHGQMLPTHVLSAI